MSRQNSRNTSTKRLLLYALGAVIIALLVFALYEYEQPVATPDTTSQQSLQSIKLDGRTIRVTIADTEATRELGLGGRDGLAPDEGMLFVFPKDGMYAFWMKDMRFSIDIVWIAQDGTIVYIAPNVSPNTYPQDFVPTSPARYVLELPANYVLENNVKIGERVSF